jgi:hypothetical protein
MIATVTLALLGWQLPGPPPGLVEFVRKLEAELMRTADPGAVLRPSCDQIAVLITRENKQFSGESIGLSQSFARTVTPGELCEYVIAVATFQLEWTMEGFKIPVSLWGDETLSRTAERFWPRARFEADAGKLSVNGIAFWPPSIESRADLDRFWKIFRSRKRPRQSRWNSNVAAHLETLGREWGWARDEIPSFAEDTGIAVVDKIYIIRAAALMGYAECCRDKPRVVILFPMNH